MIVPVEEKGGKIFSVKNLYRFPIDCDNIAANMIKRFKGVEVGDAVTVSQNCVTFATALYEAALFDDEDGQQEIDGEAAFQSEEYKKFIEAVAELQKVEILSISPEQKMAFFLNVYQAMYVHYFLRLVEEQ